MGKAHLSMGLPSSIPGVCLFIILIPTLYLERRLKFVQNNEEVAQKLSTPI
jgi:hypothetical protein